MIKSISIFLLLLSAKTVLADTSKEIECLAKNIYFEARGDGTFELLDRLSIRINNVEVSVDTIDPAGFTSLGSYSVSIPNNLNTVDICAVATLFYTNNIYLNNLRICQD